MIQADKNCWPSWTEECLRVGGSIEASLQDLYEHVAAGPYLHGRFLQVKAASPVVAYLGDSIRKMESYVAGRANMSKQDCDAQDQHLQQAYQSALQPPQAAAAAFMAFREKSYDEAVGS